jgi:hypothetical protein
MNFTAKIALALVAGTTAIGCGYPLAASANPVTGSTAAAVSIKFHKSGSGNFSINPGGNSSGGGNGVQELSAAVATGETEATAKAQSSHHGTSADARGYSAPVTLTYETYNSQTKNQSSEESAAQSEFKAQAAIEFAAGQKKSVSIYNSETEKINKTTKGRKVTNFSKEEIDIAKSKETSEDSVKLVASGEASASQSESSKMSSQSSTSNVGTVYEYKGSSAGLQFLPALVK